MGDLVNSAFFFKKNIPTFKNTNFLKFGYLMVKEIRYIMDHDS